MFKTDVDVTAFVKALTKIEQEHFPRAVVAAINDSLFDAREAWKRDIATVFDRPNALTLNAVLYRKATLDTLTGELFLRNEAAKGTPPSRYLVPSVRPGERDEKPFEFLLRNAGVLGPNEFVVPGRGYPLDPYGNVPAGVLTAILSDLSAARETTNNSTVASRLKRARRKNTAKAKVYFYNRAKHGHLPRGIYERVRFGGGSSVRMVLKIIERAPRYPKRFDAFGIAQRMFATKFPVRFRARLSEAIKATTK